MNRTTAFSVTLAVLAFAASPGRTADEDVQLWIGETVSAPFSSATHATLDLSQRFRDNGDQLLSRGTVAQSQDAGEGAHVDQWRANATLARHLGTDLEGTLGYLAILSPREGGPDKLSHVAQVTLTLRR